MSSLFIHTCAEGYVQCRSGQESRRVKNGERAIVLVNEKGDLRAAQHHRIAAAVFHLPKNIIEIESGFLLEQTVDEFGEDDSVDPFAIIFIRDLASDIEFVQGVGIDGSGHQVPHAGDGQIGEIS